MLKTKHSERNERISEAKMEALLYYRYPQLRDNPSEYLAEPLRPDLGYKSTSYGTQEESNGCAPAPY